MSVITLTKFVKHTEETVKTEVTSLKPGNVECVFEIDGAGGQGMNFADVAALDEFVASHPDSPEAAVIQSALITVKIADPTWENVDNLKNVELETPDRRATIKV